MDTPQNTLHVGWVFEKKMRYEDARPDWNGKYREDDYYVREVWVSFKDDDGTYKDLSEFKKRRNTDERP